MCPRFIDSLTQSSYKSIYKNILPLETVRHSDFLCLMTPIFAQNLPGGVLSLLPKKPFPPQRGRGEMFPCLCLDVDCAGVMTGGVCAHIHALARVPGVISAGIGAVKLG
jgi:hypothetical protein